MSDNRIPNAWLGDDAVRVIRAVTGEGFSDHRYVNRTPKYISVKIEREHLTKEQLEDVTRSLKFLHPTRFLKVYNSTANPTAWRGGECVTWKTPKVNVRFTQE